jgi:hypothetical protein
MTFRTAEPALKDVLDSIAKGETQLPDFQRGWVWDDQHIRSLIASLSRSFPIGAVMFLEAGGVPFKPRLFEGVTLQPAPSPRTLVLDGQQRLTSMYLALRSGKPVKTKTEKGEEIHRVYFFDMAKCLDLNEDRDEAVLSVPQTLQITSDFGRKVDLDLSTAALQYQQRIFPVSLMFDTQGFIEWKMGYSTHYKGDTEAMLFLMKFEQEIWLGFQQFKVPAIEMDRNTPPEAVCQVFEKVNTGGVTLTVFELMTATFAANEFSLRDDWEARKRRIKAKHAALEGVDGTDLLTAVTLLSSYQRHVATKSPVSCKRVDVLRLTLGDYQKNADKIEAGFRKAAEILAEEKIFDARGLPYATQLIPMSAICAALADTIDQHTVKQKLLRWFWCGVFGELYGGANETRFGLDLPNVVQWANGGDEPRTVRDSSFTPTRLLSLQSRLAAAYKGFTALLMKSGSRDFVTGTPIDLNTYFNNAVDIHHVFPRAWCEGQKLPREKWNSIVNKAPLAAGTNRYIGGHAPSHYLARIQKDKQIDADTLDSFLASHSIPVTQLRGDAFDEFIRLRANALLGLVEAATGKQISGRDSQETINAFGQALT